MCLQCVDSATANCAETEDEYFTLVTIMAIYSFQLQCMDHRTVTSHLIILVESMSPDLPLWPPNKHVFKSNKRLFPVYGYLGDLALLDAVGIAPQNAAFTKLFKISKHGFGDNDRIHFLQ